MTRQDVVNKLKQLAPIGASHRITFEGLSDTELRLLLDCFHHIDSRIRRSEQQARQPWRKPRGF